MVRYTRAFCVEKWVKMESFMACAGTCAGSFRLVPRSKKTVSRSEKHKSISQTWYTRYSTRRLFVGIFFTFREFILILHGAV